MDLCGKIHAIQVKQTKNDANPRKLAPQQLSWAQEFACVKTICYQLSKKNCDCEH